MRRLGWLVAILALLALGAWLAPRVGRLVPDTTLAALPGPLQQLLLEPVPTGLPAPVAAPGMPATWEPLLPPTLPPPATPTVRATASPDGAVGAVTEPTRRPLPTETARPAPTTTPAPQPVGQAQLSGLRIVPQTFNNCGPANLSIVLGYFGLAIDQEATAAGLRGNEVDRNVSPEEMVAFVQRETRLEATVVANGDLLLLKRLLDAGLPVIIEKGYEPEGEAWMGHYLTLFGYDESAGVFLGLDTFLGPWDGSGREEPYQELQAYWRHFNRTLIVVYRSEQTSLVAELVGPGRWDPARMWEGAARQAQHEVQAEPSDAFAWFNLGSSLTRLGDLTGETRFYEDAARAFDQARLLGLPFRMLWYQFEPYRAYLEVGRTEEVLALAEATIDTRGGQSVEETYYYQGLALAEEGDIEGARAALLRALGLNDSLEAARAALVDLASR